MNFFTELKKRMELPSPAFFQKLTKFGNWLMGLAMLIIAPDIPANIGFEFPELVPSEISKIAGYVFVAGFFISRVSKLTVADPTKLDQ